MKTIRTNCFETNSSSTHSITIDDSYVLKEDPRGTHVAPGEFGWEHSKFNSFEKKASYFWTLAQSDNYEWERMGGSLKERMLRIAATYGFGLHAAVRDSWSYVDHGWEHYADMCNRRPDLLTDEGLYAFLTNESCWIMTGNDNSPDVPNLRMTPNQIKACTKFFVLEADEKYRYAMIDGGTEESYADTAAYAYLDELRGNDYGMGWHHITPNNDGTITIELKKYNHKLSKDELVRTFTLTYRIENTAPETQINCL
jgi:hypothetical protein